MPNKILIDIGNTNTSIAVTRGKRIAKRFFIHTSRKNISPSSFRRLLGRFFPDTGSFLVASVVPRFLAVLKKVLGNIAGRIPLRVVGRNARVPIKNRYKKPAEVGQDRLLASFAAAARCGGGPVIVIDFGTAVTVDYVNGRGEYEGGFIFPGMRLGLAAIEKNAALLPSIWLANARGFIGRDTRSSMNNGILYGYAAVCDGLVERIRKSKKNNAKVIATGGDARLVAKYSKHIRKICPDLIFEGMMRLNADIHG